MKQFNHVHVRFDHKFYLYTKEQSFPFFPVLGMGVHFSLDLYLIVERLSFWATGNDILVVHYQEINCNAESEFQNICQKFEEAGWGTLDNTV